MRAAGRARGEHLPHALGLAATPGRGAVGAGGDLRLGWYNARCCVVTRLPGKSGIQCKDLRWRSIVLNLGILRKNRDSLDMEDACLPQVTAVQESMRQWIALQMSFEWQLQQTAALFERDRWAALIELQARLRRLSS